jgi:hypothetical protein
MINSTKIKTIFDKILFENLNHKNQSKNYFFVHFLNKFFSSSYISQKNANILTVFHHKISQFLLQFSPYINQPYRISPSRYSEGCGTVIGPCFANDGPKEWKMAEKSGKSLRNVGKSEQNINFLNTTAFLQQLHIILPFFTDSKLRKSTNKKNNFVKNYSKNELFLPNFEHFTTQNFDFFSQIIELIYIHFFNRLIPILLPYITTSVRLFGEKRDNKDVSNRNISNNIISDHNLDQNNENKQKSRFVKTNLNNFEANENKNKNKNFSPFSEDIFSPNGSNFSDENFVNNYHKPQSTPFSQLNPSDPLPYGCTMENCHQWMQLYVYLHGDCPLLVQNQQNQQNQPNQPNLSKNPQPFPSFSLENFQDVFIVLDQAMTLVPLMQFVLSTQFDIVDEGWDNQTMGRDYNIQNDRKSKLNKLFTKNNNNNIKTKHYVTKFTTLLTSVLSVLLSALHSSPLHINGYLPVNEIFSTKNINCQHFKHFSNNNSVEKIQNKIPIQILGQFLFPKREQNFDLFNSFSFADLRPYLTTMYPLISLVSLNHQYVCIDTIDIVTDYHYGSKIYSEKIAKIEKIETIKPDERQEKSPQIGNKSIKTTTNTCTSPDAILSDVLYYPSRIDNPKDSTKNHKSSSIYHFLFSNLYPLIWVAQLSDVATNTPSAYPQCSNIVDFQAESGHFNVSPSQKPLNRKQFHLSNCLSTLSIAFTALVPLTPFLEEKSEIFILFFTFFTKWFKITTSELQEQYSIVNQNIRPLYERLIQLKRQVTELQNNGGEIGPNFDKNNQIEPQNTSQYNNQPTSKPPQQLLLQLSQITAQYQRTLGEYQKLSKCLVMIGQCNLFVFFQLFQAQRYSGVYLPHIMSKYFTTSHLHPWCSYLDPEWGGEWNYGLGKGKVDKIDKGDKGDKNVKNVKNLFKNNQNVEKIDAIDKITNNWKNNYINCSFFQQYAIGSSQLSFFSEGIGLAIGKYTGNDSINVAIPSFDPEISEFFENKNNFCEKNQFGFVKTSNRFISDSLLSNLLNNCSDQYRLYNLGSDHTIGLNDGNVDKDKNEIDKNIEDNKDKNTIFSMFIHYFLPEDDSHQLYSLFAEPITGTSTSNIGFNINKASTYGKNDPNLPFFDSKKTPRSTQSFPIQTQINTFSPYITDSTVIDDSFNHLNLFSRKKTFFYSIFGSLFSIFTFNLNFSDLLHQVPAFKLHNHDVPTVNSGNSCNSFTNLGNFGQNL